MSGLYRGYFHDCRNSPCPSYLKRGIFGKIDEIRVFRWQKSFGALGFDIVRDLVFGISSFFESRRNGFHHNLELLATKC